MHFSSILFILLSFSLDLLEKARQKTGRKEGKWETGKKENGKRRKTGTEEGKRERKKETGNGKERKRMGEKENGNGKKKTGKKDGKWER